MTRFLLTTGAFLCALFFLAGCDIEVPQAEEKGGSSVTFQPHSNPVSEQRSAPVQEDFSTVQEALDALVRASEEDDKQQQVAAYNWLCKQSGDAAPTVAAAMNDPRLPMEARRHACGVLGHLGPAATEALIEASRSEEIALQLKAVETMPVVDPPQQAIVQRLVALLGDPSDQVVNTSIRSLGQIGPPARDAADELLALRDNIELNETTRQTAGQALKLVRPIRTFQD